MRLRAATALIGLALLTACSGSSNPRVLPTLTPVPTTTFSPAALPRLAKARSPQGADAFVHFFFEQLNFAFSSSSPETIRALSNSECETCATYEESLTDARSKGRRIEGDSFAVDTVAAAPLQSLGTLVEVTGHVPARRVVNADGKVMQSLPTNGSFHFTVAVKWVSGHWLVSAIGRSP